MRRIDFISAATRHRIAAACSALWPRCSFMACARPVFALHFLYRSHLSPSKAAPRRRALDLAADHGHRSPPAPALPLPPVAKPPMPASPSPSPPSPRDQSCRPKLPTKACPSWPLTPSPDPADVRPLASAASTPSDSPKAARLPMRRRPPLPAYTPGPNVLPHPPYPMKRAIGGENGDVFDRTVTFRCPAAALARRAVDRALHIERREQSSICETSVVSFGSELGGKQRHHAVQRG